MSFVFALLILLLCCSVALPSEMHSNKGTKIALENKCYISHRKKKIDIAKQIPSALGLELNYKNNRTLFWYFQPIEICLG